MEPLFTQSLESKKAFEINCFKYRLTTLSSNALASLAASHKNGFDLIWNNLVTTPSEAFAALGVDGARFVQGSAATSQFLITQYALAVTPYAPVALPVGVSLVINSDGTVTVVYA